MAPVARVELDENGEPLVNAFDELSYKSLSPMLKLLFFVGPFTIGLYEHNTLMESHLLRISAIIMGFCFSVISFLTACLLPVFVLGVEYDFATEVFHLYKDIRFSIAMAFVFVLLLLSRFLTRSILRTVTSYRYRRYVFIVSFIINLACITAIIDYVSSLFKLYVFLFNIVVAGIIFLILIRQKKEPIKTRMRLEGYSHHYNH